MNMNMELDLNNIDSNSQENNFKLKWETPNFKAESLGKTLGGFTPAATMEGTWYYNTVTS